MLEYVAELVGGRMEETNRGKAKGMDFNAEGGDVLLFEFTCKMTLDERSLHRTNVISLPYIKTAYRCLTFPVPPSPTRTSLKVGGASAMIVYVLLKAGDMLSTSPRMLMKVERMVERTAPAECRSPLT
jgi:hypothetical protein